MSIHMLEQWIADLGGRIDYSIYEPASDGGGDFGAARTTDLRLRYAWEYLQIGYGPTFSRWANSVDWDGPIPESREALAKLFAEVRRRGEAGDFGSAT